MTNIVMGVLDVEVPWGIPMRSWLIFTLIDSQVTMATPPGYTFQSSSISSQNLLLQKPTLKDLTSELYTTVASEWRFIGIQLQLKSGELDTFKTKEDKAALIEVLEMWLKTVDPPPTWKAIIDAVRLFNPSLATSLTTKYCT